ncbi:hypothetical protein BH10ACT2_BH10ACT2_23140 [soil metagenome]
MIWIYVAAAVILVVAIWLLRARRPESGSTAYRRHIDALSPESRRATFQGNDPANDINRRKR